jgi:hypothetical protein
MNEHNKTHPLPEAEVERLGQAIRGVLQAQESHVDAVVTARLAAARRRAVAAAGRPAVQTAAITADAGGRLALVGGWRSRLLDWRFWAVGLAVAVLLVATQPLWRGPVYEPKDVDLFILADDVPVDALLDRGFSLFIQQDE